MKNKITKFIVYVATNTANGKRYVGATSIGLPLRKYQHVYSVRIGKHRCRVFHDAIKKYGEESFKWEVLSDAPSFEKMMAEEIRLIREIKPEYNMTAGGEGTLGFSLGPLSADHRALAVAALTRGQIKIKKRVVLVESGEVFDSIALAARKYFLNEKELYLCIEQGNPCRGFTFRVIDAKGQPIVIPSMRTMRQVICLTDMVVSNSILAASERYGVLRATLTRRCDRNDDAPIGAYRFCYLDEWRPNPE